MKKIFTVLLLLLTATVGCETDGNAVTGPYTIMSWNVEMFKASDAFDKIAGEVKRQGVDILLLSECQNNGDEETRFAAALDKAGYPMNYHRFASYWNGLGIFSRLPITASSEVAYADGPRYIYRTTIQTPAGTNLTVYGGHLKSGTDLSSYNRRVAQSKALADYIRDNHNETADLIIILGDMNTMGTNGTVNCDFAQGGTLHCLTLQDDTDPANDFLPVNYTYRRDTDTHNWPSLLDHIILSPAAVRCYIPGSVQVPATPWYDGINLYSDHRPVLLQLDL